MYLYFLAIGAFALGVLLRSFILVPIAMEVLVVATGVVLLVASRFTHRNSYLSTGILLLFFVTGVIRTQIVSQELPEAFRPLINSEVRLEGVIAANPDVRQKNQRITIHVVRDHESTNLIAVVPIYQTFTYGEQVRVSGMFTTPQPFASDGGRTFAYDRYLSKDGVFALIQRAQIQILAPPRGFIAHTYDFLYALADGFSSALGRALPEPEAGLAVGLIVGGKQGLGENLLDAFTAAGVVQIVVLSGYNVMIVAEGILKVASFLPRRIAYAVSALGIVGFVLAAGSGSSAVRAGLMACIALFARATGRTYDVLRALFFVLLCMLLWNPLLLAFDPGFQLSCMATLGLILASSLVEQRLMVIRNASVREAVATTLAAEIFILPLLLWQTGNLSLVSIPANVLISFIVPMTMAAAAFAGFLALIVPPLAPFFGLPAYVLLFIIITIAQQAAALPFSHVIIPSFSFALVLLSYAGIAWLLRREQKMVLASASTDASTIFKHAQSATLPQTVSHTPPS